MRSKVKENLIKAIDALKIRPYTKELLIQAKKLIQQATEYAKNLLLKIYDPKIEEAVGDITGIKLALSDMELYVGDEVGLVAHLLPHHWNRNNPFIAYTSDSSVVELDGMILTAKSVGTSTITVTTQDGNFSDSILITVVEPYVFEPKNEYNVEPERFNLVDGLDVSEEQALINTRGIKSLFMWAKESGYEKIVFPKDKVYMCLPYESVYVRSNTVIDLNGSKIQIYPTIYCSYQFLYLFDDSEAYPNVANPKIENLSDKTLLGYSNYITDYSPNETGAMTYWRNYVTSLHYNYTIEAGGLDEVVSYPIYVREEINQSDYNQYIGDKIIKGRTYNITFGFVKRRPYDYADDQYVYTSNKVKLFVDFYKDNNIVESKNIASANWSKKYNNSSNLSGSITIVDDIDYIKLRISGLSDPNYPILNIISPPVVRQAYTAETLTSNIILTNGYVWGDAKLTNSEGKEIKTSIWKELYGSDWRQVQKTEGCANISLSKGFNVCIKNCDIGMSPGFNMCIGDHKSLQNYFPSNRNFVFGNLDDDMNEIDATDYIRSPFIQVDTTKYRKMIVTDPTFSTIYYFGQRSRIIDVYAFDKDKNLLKKFQGKMRHSRIELPEGTCYLRICCPMLPGEEISAGNSDFNGCVFAIKFIDFAEHCKVKGCTIHDNYSCGIALTGNSIYIEDNNFYNNIGRMPWCDIDSEDGWQFMQNIVIRNNTFGSYYGLILCAGINYIIKNNLFNGPITMYADCMWTKVYGNTFNPKGYGSSFGNSFDCYIVKNNFNGIGGLSANTKDSCYFKVNYLDNNIYNGRLTFGRNKGYVARNKFTGTLTLTGDSGALDSPDKNDISEVTSIIIDGTVSASNLTLGANSSWEIMGNKKLTLNNCIVYKQPWFYNNTGKVTFNNCTIYNSKVSSLYEYNNCTLIDGVVDAFVIPELLHKDKLDFAFQGQGGYNGLQKDYIKKSGDISSWHLTMLNNRKGQNYRCALECTGFVVGTSHTMNQVSFNRQTIKADGNPVNNMWSQIASTDLINFENVYVIDADYDMSTHTFKEYINGTLIYTKKLTTDLYDLSNNTLNLISSGDIEKCYLFNDSISDEDVYSNYMSLYGATRNLFMNVNKQDVVNIKTGGSGSSFKLKLINPITENVTINIISSDPRLVVSPNTITFTPDNYSVEQTVSYNTNSVTDSYTAKISLTSDDIEVENTKNISIAVLNDDEQDESVYIKAVPSGNLLSPKTSDVYFGVHMYPVTPGATYTITAPSQITIRYLLYNDKKSHVQQEGVKWNTKTFDLTIPNNAYYIRLGYATSEPESYIGKTTIVLK